MLDSRRRQNLQLRSKKLIVECVQNLIGKTRITFKGNTEGNMNLPTVLSLEGRDSSSSYSCVSLTYKTQIFILPSPLVWYTYSSAD